MAVLATFFGTGLATGGAVWAQPNLDDEGEPMPPLVQVATPTLDNADPAAVSACAQFAEILDATALYYGEFASAIDGYVDPNYSDPVINSTSLTGRTALREAAAVARLAADTPGLPPDIAGPMHDWSWDAMKLAVKMGLRGGAGTLNDGATELNDNAVLVQNACAAAGTHA